MSSSSSSSTTMINTYQVVKRHHEQTSDGSETMPPPPTGPMVPVSSVGQASNDSNNSTLSDLTTEQLSKPPPTKTQLLTLAEDEEVSTDFTNGVLQAPPSHDDEESSSALDDSVTVSQNDKSYGSLQYSATSSAVQGVNSNTYQWNPDSSSAGHVSGGVSSAPNDASTTPKDIPEQQQGDEQGGGGGNRRRLYIILCLVLLCIIGGVVAAVVLLVGGGGGGGGDGTNNVAGQPTTVPPMPPAPTPPTANPTDGGMTPAPAPPPSGVVDITPVPTPGIPTPVPTPMPATGAPNSQVRTELQNLLVAISVDGGQNLRSPGTAQNRAFEWLANFPAVSTFSRSGLIDRYALATLYFSTGGENWNNQTGWLVDPDVCNWYPQVVSTPPLSICDENGDVLFMDLRNNVLVGTLPVEIIHMPSLAVLVLSNNRLRGTIPRDYYAAGQLQWFDVFNNSLTGIIPTEIGRLNGLIYQDFDSNRFRGTLPSEYGLLTQLSTLWLNRNNFVGTIPTEFARMTSLENLYLTENSLTGTVPLGLCSLQLMNLQADCEVVCACCTNQATCPGDPVRTQLQNILAGVAFDGGQNLMTPGTPQNRAFEWLVSSPGLSALTEYQLIERYSLATLYYSTAGDSWDNRTGWLTDPDVCNWYPIEIGDPPQSICNQDRIVDLLIVQRNNLVGTIPPELAHMTSLLVMALPANLLSATIPIDLYRELPLSVLNLFNNEFTGTMPTEIGLMTTLRHVDFDTNMFSGALPSEFGLLTQMTTLWLNNNRFAGTIPTQFAMMTNLQNLYLTGNALTGTVPDALCTLPLVNLEADCEVGCNCCTNQAGCTSSPSRAPAITNAPTSTVTMAPVIGATFQPTGMATNQTSRMRLQNLLAGIAFDGGQSLMTAGTSQNRAFEWLASNPGVSSYSDYRLTERYALATLYYSTRGDSWDNRTGWLVDPDVCNWYPIVFGNQQTSICDRNGDVAVLFLQENKLVGTLPPELAHMTSLVAVAMFGNVLTGTVPVQYYRELPLTFIHMFDNLLTGTIPTEIGLMTALQFQDFDGNEFMGTLPTEYGQLTQMTTLWLNQNNFVGTIPTEFARMTSLVNLYLGGNSLTGTVPAGLCALQLSNLEVDCEVGCSCCTNRDSCNVTMAPSLAPVAGDNPVQTRLQDLLVGIAFDGGQSLMTPGTPQNKAFEWLASNPGITSYTDYRLIERYCLATLYYSTGGESWANQTGWLVDPDVCNWYPRSIGETMLSTCAGSGDLGVVLLNRNNLVGTLPPELAHMTSLYALSLVSNQLTGTIPLEYYRDLPLGLINVFNNTLAGTIPTEIGLLTELQNMNYAANLFEGALPSEIGQLANMTSLRLNQNAFTGTIPTDVARLTNLENLVVTGNNFTGTVPDGLCTLQVSNLAADCELECNCCTNQLNCPATPSDLFTTLASLSPDGGTALRTPGSPQERAYQWLTAANTTLELSQRQQYALATFFFSTGGENWLQRYSFLSPANECTWYTTEIGGPICNSLGQILEIDLDGNNLADTIPDELAFLAGSLNALDFFNNRLNGTVPTTVGLLTQLTRVVDFDSNNLVGTIPTELGMLDSLEILWLNNNNLTGTIPTELGRMTSLQELYLDNNPGLHGTVPASVCALNPPTLRVDCNNVVCSCCNPACPPPPVSNATAFSTLVNQLAPLSPDGGATWNITVSPQYRALAWLSTSPSLSQLSPQSILERYVLATLYYSTNGPSWNVTTGWLTESDHCTWYNTGETMCIQGVGVTTIVLTSNLLVGTVPRELGMLSNTLVNLALDQNSRLVGDLPVDLASLSFMRVLFLSSTRLDGTVPTELGRLTNLVVFATYDTLVMGTIPTEVGLWTSLDALDVGLTSMTGTLPSEIGQLAAMRAFSVFGTEVSGTIPTEFASLTSLERLFLDDTNLVGPFPQAICTISSLNTFWSDCDEIGCTCCTTCCSGSNDQNCV